MFYVFENENNNASIVYDGNTLTDLHKQNAIAISNLPEKENGEGKNAILKCNKSTGEVWWEYEDVQQTDEQILKEELDKVKVQLQTTQEAVDFLLMTGGM